MPRLKSMKNNDLWVAAVEKGIEYEQMIQNGGSGV